MFRSTRKGKKCVCDEPASVWPPGITQHRIFIKCFWFCSDVLAFFCLYSLLPNFWSLRKFIKQYYYIPFALVGYETGYSHLISNVCSCNINNSILNIYYTKVKVSIKCWPGVLRLDHGIFYSWFLRQHFSIGYFTQWYLHSQCSTKAASSSCLGQVISSSVHLPTGQAPQWGQAPSMN